MKMLQRFACLLLCAALFLTLLAGCGKQEEPAEDFVVSAAVCGPLETLDPTMNTDVGAESLLSTLFEGLMRMRDDGAGKAVAVAGIAKEYIEEKNYDDTVTYTFTLRSAARWSDGERVTAEDFVYAWQRLVDPATASPNASLLSMVAGYDEVRESGDVSLLGVKAKGESTFLGTLSRPCAYFITSVCTSPATAPLRRDLVEGNASWAATADIVTNGPYTVGTWVKAAQLQTKRNGEYYESKLVVPDSICFRFETDAQTNYDQLLAGELDYTAKLPYAAIEQLAEDETWQPAPLAETVCVLYNHLTDTFSDAQLRRAFDLAIDRAAATAAGGAENSPATGLVPYGIPDSGETEDDFRTTGGELCAIDEAGMSARATQAQEELTYAGYYSTSMFPPVELLYVTGTENDAVASALQSMWSTTLGVNVILRGVTQSEYNMRMEAGNYELALQKVTALYDDAMGFLDRWCSEDEQNLISYENGSYDVLMGVARASEDPVARTAFLHDAETMLLGETALSPVYFDGTAHMLRDTLRGVYTDGFGNSYFAGVRANTD